ncbi:LmeA family phospholipid-binding protein [Kitasatospora sp. NPDC098652]|uniref:LmeA family phospholipid-binding protein n=1 Tax=Kitasatospora sp. NPDC098652 TaxID=3364095 RepID=UPI00382E13C4
MPLAALRRHPVLAATATLAALTLGATGADRAAAQYAQHRTADAFQQAAGTPQTPQVTIDGFPILSQVVAGRFHPVSGALPDAGTQLIAKIFGQPIPLHNIPQGLHLDALRTNADGPQAQLTGDNVTFRTGAPAAGA